jgi:hypothetical protein
VEDSRDDRVRSFLDGRIDSVEQLHVLILLHDSKGRAWTIAAISEELRSSESSVTKRLQTLIDRKILAPESVSGPKIEYHPYDVATDADITETAIFYREKPYRVIDIIFSKPRDPIQTLADAFRFKKDKE